MVTQSYATSQNNETRSVEQEMALFRMILAVLFGSSGLLLYTRNRYLDVQQTSLELLL